MVDNLYTVGLGLDASDFEQSLRQAERALGNFERRANRFSKEFGSVNKAVGDANRSLGVFESAIASGFGAAIGTAAIQGLTTGFQAAQRAIFSTGRTVISFANEGTKLASTSRILQSTLDAVTDSAADSSQAFNFFVETTEQLGFSQSELSKSYLNLLSAANSTGLGLTETNKIFSSLIENARLFGQNSADVEGAVLGITQSLGRANIQGDELNQIIDRIPGGLGLLRQGLGLTTEEFEELRSKGALPARESILVLADAISSRAQGALGPALSSAEGQAAQFRIELEKFQRNLGDVFLPIRQEVFRIGGDIIAQLNEENNLFEQLERAAGQFAEDLAQNPDIVDDIAESLGDAVRAMSSLVASSAEFAGNLASGLRRIDDLVLGTRRAAASLVGREEVFDVEYALRERGLSDRDVERLSQQALEQTRQANRFGGLGRTQREEQARRLQEAGERLLRSRSSSDVLNTALGDLRTFAQEAIQVEEEIDQAVSSNRTERDSDIARRRQETAAKEFEKAQTDAQRLADEKQQLLEQETQNELSAIRELFDIENTQSQRLHELNLQYIDLELNARLRGLGTYEREAKRQSNDLISQLTDIENRSRETAQQIEQAQFGLSQAEQFNRLIGAGTTVPFSSGGGAGGGGSSFLGFTGASGRGSGPHLDVRLRGGARRLTEQELGRFTVGGQPLSNFPITSEFGPRRAPVPGASTFHGGVDYGTAVGQRIETTVPIQSVNLRDPSQTGGGGWVTDVVFEDGLEVSLLHLDPSTQGAALGGSGRSRTPTLPTTPQRSQATGLIAGFEGFSPTAYFDRTQYTYGYGTQAPGAGATISEEEAQRVLGQEVERFAQGVQELVTTQLNQNQLDALTSFAFNVGLSAFSESTLLRELNQGNIQNAADELLRWTRSGDSELQGLVSRRQAERDLFLTPTGAAAGAAGAAGGTAFAGPSLQDTRALQANVTALEEYNRQQQELFDAQRAGAIADYFDSLTQGYRDEADGLRQSLEVRRLELSLRDETPEFIQQSIQAYEEERETVSQLGAQLNELMILREQGVLSADEYAQAQDSLADSVARLREVRAEAREQEYIAEQLAIEAQRTETLTGIYEEQADLLAELRLRITALSEGRSELSRSEERHLELQQQGISLSAEEAAALRQQDEAIDAYSTELERLSEAQAAVESFEQTLIGSFSNAAQEIFSFSDDIGTTVGNLAESILGSLASLAFNSVFQNIFGGIFGGAGGALGGIFGGGGGTEPFLGSFQAGGVIDRRGIAQVGEAGPEAIVPLQSGAIPVQLQGGGSGAQQQVSVTVNVNAGSGQSEVDVQGAGDGGQALAQLIVGVINTESRHGGILDRMYVKR